MVDYLWANKPPILPNGAPIRVAMEEVNFLLLDDFEVFSSEHKNRAVEGVLKARNDALRPTIITTNLPWTDILDLGYLKSICFDRYYPVSVTGINWRQKPPVPQTAT